MNSVKKILAITLVILFSGYFESLCQMEKFEEFNPKNKDWELYVTFSTTGGGAGTKVKWGTGNLSRTFFRLKSAAFAVRMNIQQWFMTHIMDTNHIK